MSQDVETSRRAVSLVLDRYGPFIERKRREELFKLLSLGADLPDHHALAATDNEITSPLDNIELIREKNSLGVAVYRLLLWVGDPELASVGSPGGTPYLREGLTEFLAFRIVPVGNFRINRVELFSLIQELVDGDLLEIQAIFECYFHGRDSESLFAMLDPPPDPSDTP